MFPCHLHSHWRCSESLCPSSACDTNTGGRSHSPPHKPLPSWIRALSPWVRVTVTHFKYDSDALWSSLPPSQIKRLIILSPSHSDRQAGIRLHLTLKASCGASDGWLRLWDPNYTSRFWVTLTWNTSTKGAVRMEEDAVQRAACCWATSAKLIGRLDFYFVQ